MAATSRPPLAVSSLDCPFAHSANRAGHRHSLIEHLRGTAERARGFGASFGQADACYAAGLWHDIGKVTPGFQEYLAACDTPTHPPRGPNHKDAAAVLASRDRRTAHLVPLLLGHHGGIPNVGDAANCCQLASKRSDVADAIAWACSALPDAAGCKAPNFADMSPPDEDVLQRLTFSSLVDADFLDTEAHFDPQRSSDRFVDFAPIAELVRREEASLANFLACRVPRPVVDGVRSDVREAALEAALTRPGLFRLTVPTGGGKTRTALAFALRHAECWGLERVITAVPFLTITEQTAETYREMVGTDEVLEHHSGAQPPEAIPNPRMRVWRRLAAENWDARIIVTTTLQLLESFFSNRPSDLRKAHRLARSVLILDEAQTLPLHVLGVTVDALGALARVAGSSIVLCTATQPALELVDDSLQGTIRELVPRYPEHFSVLKRVTYSVPATDEVWDWPRVAAEISTSGQSMAIVNRRKDAVGLLDQLGADAFHLSTLICGAHRRRVLAAVRGALVRGDPCHLISTQVVEAGVDLDFPLVLRALAPYDSIVQAGGRCNREGRLSTGRCIIFKPAQPDALGTYRRGIDVLQNMLMEGPIDFDDPTVCHAYYQRLYGQGSVNAVALDRKNIRRLVAERRFQAIADEYRVIEEATEPVVVPYPPDLAEVQYLLADVAAAVDPGQARAILRRLQPFIVSLRRRDIDRMRTKGVIEDFGGIHAWTGAYDLRIGVGTELFDPSPTDNDDGAGGGYVV